MITISTDKFFFSWRTEHGMPHVVHFYVKCAARSFTTSSQCARFMVKYFKLRGNKRIMLNTLLRRPYLSKIVEWFFRVKPYATQDGHNFYLVEVN